MNASKAPKTRKKAKKAGKAVGPAPTGAERLQYAALPWRLAERLEVMLVSSRETRRWIIPKGWPMAGRSASAAAAIEAMEEAGLLGVIAQESFGHYFYVKKFSRGETALCRVEVFPLQVQRQREDWPEKDQRVTQWFPAEEAMELVSDPELRDLIAEFIRFSAA
jgi:8-oxo-dGTP pyrophosphatase MutT (NUDIX family)